MQKEIQKRISMYVRSIKVIEERRSDVPLKPHRRKFPSFGSGKIAGSDIRESSTVIRPSVISLFHPFCCRLTISAYRRHRKEYVFQTFPAENTTSSTDLRKKKKKDAEKRKPRLISLRIRESGTLKGDAKRRPPVLLADKRKWHP